MVSLLPRPRTCPQPRSCRPFGAGRVCVTMVVLLASVAAGCGGGAHGHRAAGTRGGRGVAPGPYRWLVATTGPQPTVAEENAHPGTTAWRLPGPAADVGGLASGSVVGYVAEQALRPGQTERIYGARAGRAARPDSGSTGWAGTGNRRARGARKRQVVPIVAQPPCTHRPETGLTECDGIRHSAS